VRKRDEKPFTGVSTNKKSHIVTRFSKERRSFFKINDISFFGTLDCHHHRISIPAYAVEQQWWQSGIPKNEMSLSVSISGSISNIYWHASKRSSISFSHWHCPSDREFSFPRFVSLLILSLWLIDQQSVGKRSLHLMNTANAKKRWKTIYWRVNKFLKESHIVTCYAIERATFLKINDINDISLRGTPDCHHCYSIA
jgi:hypothetical protein